MNEWQTIVYKQSFETKVEVGNRLSAKGEQQPEVKIMITRQLENKADVYHFITTDIDEALKKVKEALEKLKWNVRFVTAK